MSDTEINQKLTEILARLDTITGAFPHNDDGSIDAHGHRMAHEEAIKASKEQQEFWRGLKLDLAKNGIRGVILVVLGLAFVGALTKLGLSPPIK